MITELRVTLLNILQHHSSTPGGTTYHLVFGLCAFCISAASVATAAAA